VTDWLTRTDPPAPAPASRPQGQPAEVMASDDPSRVEERAPGFWVRARDGRRACGAKARQGPCRVVYGLHPKTFRCNTHVGLSGVTGAAHPSYRGRGWSKDIPTRLVERFQASMDDPDLLSQRAEIALLDARIGDLLRQVDTGESIRAWAEAKRLFRQMKEANARGDAAGIATAVQGLDRVLDKGATDALAWKDVLATVEQRRKIVQTEHEHQDREEQMITLERALLLVGSLQNAVMTHVRDTRTQQAISAEFLRITEGASR